MVGASRLDEDIADDQPMAAYPPQVQFESVGHPDEPVAPMDASAVGVRQNTDAPTTAAGGSAPQSVKKPEADTRKGEAKPAAHTVRGEVLKSLKQLHTVHRLVDDTEILATSLNKALKKEVSHLKAENNALKQQLKAADEENAANDFFKEEAEIAKMRKVADGKKKEAKRGKAGAGKTKETEEVGEVEKKSSASDSAASGGQKGEATTGEVGSIEKKAIAEAGETEKSADSVVAEIEKKDESTDAEGGEKRSATASEGNEKGSDRAADGEERQHAVVSEGADQGSDGQEQTTAEHRSRATRRATAAKPSRQAAATVQAEKQAAAKEVRIAAGEEQAAKAQVKDAAKEESQAKEVFNFVSKI